MPSSRPTQTFSMIPRGLRTRFAPSPTGFLHLGHVASAIYVWGLARKSGAEVVLRMEDHDQGRVRKDYETSILDDLAWLGFKADAGVASSDKASDYRQSDHWSRYENALQNLGDRVYRCQCSRKEILERTGKNSEELWYDGFCRVHNQGPNIRLMLDSKSQTFVDGLLGEQIQTVSEQCGDLLLRDRDGFWTYNFAVTVDDIEEDISLIIRGQDILTATGRQLKLREQLGAKKQPLYIHHPLIWMDETKKLSKRDRSTSIGQWRDQGFLAADIIGKAAFQVGLIPTERPIQPAEVEDLFHV